MKEVAIKDEIFSFCMECFGFHATLLDAVLMEDTVMYKQIDSFLLGPNHFVFQ